ncbi:MAG: hypothetical protein ACKPCQ_05655, partial [Dolichospermum sp.]
GGKGAYIYLCGQAGFANTIKESLEQVIAEFSQGSPQERRRLAQEMMVMRLLVNRNFYRV